MFDQWKVLHVDEVESESILFCRALALEQFAGHCESVRTLGAAELYLERALFTPQALSRPDIIVINWHSGPDTDVLEFVHWVRAQPQLFTTAIVVFITAEFSFAAQERARSEGVTELMVRPDTFKELRKQVEYLLKQCAGRCVLRWAAA